MVIAGALLLFAAAVSVPWAPETTDLNLDQASNLGEAPGTPEATDAPSPLPRPRETAFQQGKFE
jgi:putative MFS transporter